MVRMLCGPDARYITGQSIHPNAAGSCRHLSCHEAPERLHRAGRQEELPAVAERTKHRPRHDRGDGVRLAPSARQEGHFLRQGASAARRKPASSAAASSPPRSMPRSPTACARTRTRPTIRMRLGDAPGLRHRASRSCRRRKRRQEWRSVTARGGAGLRRGDPAHDVAQRVQVPRGRPLDPQLRPDLRRFGSRRDARGCERRAGRYLLSCRGAAGLGISCWMRDEEHIEKAFDFGGMPARNGVTAATMVAQGFSGVDDVFSGERNFFVAHGRRRIPSAWCAGWARSTRSCAPTSSAGRWARRSRLRWTRSRFSSKSTA